MEENFMQREENEGTCSGWELKKVYNNQEKDDEGVIKWQLQGQYRGEGLIAQTEVKSQDWVMDWLWGRAVVKDKD